jgi:hypothetical protein
MRESLSCELETFPAGAQRSGQVRPAFRRVFAFWVFASLKFEGLGYTTA